MVNLLKVHSEFRQMTDVFMEFMKLPATFNKPSYFFEVLRFITLKCFEEHFALAGFNLITIYFTVS